eukprot:14229102-Alexandrium_andersonii.AAC.1
MDGHESLTLHRIDLRKACPWSERSVARIAVARASSPAAGTNEWRGAGWVCSHAFAFEGRPVRGKQGWDRIWCP